MVGSLCDRRGSKRRNGQRELVSPVSQTQTGLSDLSTFNHLQELLAVECNTFKGCLAQPWVPAGGSSSVRAAAHAACALERAACSQCCAQPVAPPLPCHAQTHVHAPVGPVTAWHSLHGSAGHPQVRLACLRGHARRNERSQTANLCMAANSVHSTNPLPCPHLCTCRCPQVVSQPHPHLEGLSSCSR